MNMKLQIALVSCTQSDGTPFPHNSVQEEDLEELCMGLGKAHTEGVLWIMEIEVVITF